MNNSISIELNGKTYVGTRTIAQHRGGFRQQTIYYAGRSEYSSMKFRAGDDEIMDLMAKTILRQMVEAAEAMNRNH